MTKRQSPRHKQIVQEVEGIARALAGAPLRISKIYESMSVSPGMVRFAFRNVHGCSPRRFFRDQRLRAVRSELRSASPRLTVTEVATRHGFVELGRFAAQYRAAFGESPSATLRRSLREHRQQTVHDESDDAPTNSEH